MPTTNVNQHPNFTAENLDAWPSCVFSKSRFEKRDLCFHGAKWYPFGPVDTEKKTLRPNHTLKTPFRHEALLDLCFFRHRFRGLLASESDVGANLSKVCSDKLK